MGRMRERNEEGEERKEAMEKGGQRREGEEKGWGGEIRGAEWGEGLTHTRTKDLHELS